VMRRYLIGSPARGLQRSSRSGMTLVEVLIAIVILSTALLSISAYMMKLAQTISQSDVKGAANEIAADQIETVKTAPRYVAIESLYVATTTMPSPYVGFTRQTLVTHTGGGATDLYDYKTITVIVTNKRLATPVKKTDIIAAF
jgi:prepilin-type N-terminal cleavage/methylation domain-containing protein